MKRLFDNGAHSARTLPQLLGNPFAQLPSEIMPNIWSRLPEEALAALLCADRYLNGLHGAGHARRLQREVILTLRPRFRTFDKFDRCWFERISIKTSLDVCRDLACNEEVCARNMALVSRRANEDRDGCLKSSELSQKLFNCLQSLNSDLQAQFLDTLFYQRVPKSSDTFDLYNFVNFLRLLGGHEKDSRRALSKVSSLNSLSPKCAAALKMWLLDRISCEADERTADPVQVFAPLVDHISGLQGAELADALPWLPALLLKNSEGYDSDFEELDSICAREKARAYLMQTYFDRCAKLEPALAFKIHAAAMETAFLLYEIENESLTGFDEVAEVVAAMMQSLLQLKGKALAVAMQELLRRRPYAIEKRGMNLVALCRHIEQSVPERKAALMVELLMVAVYSASKHPSELCFLNFAEGDGPRVALREIFAMCLALPSQDMSADALAMLSCVIAYMPNSELQSGAVDRIIALLGTKAPSEHPSLWILLAHLSVLLDQAKRTNLCDMLHQAARHMPQVQSNALLAAMTNAEVLERICARRGLSMKGVCFASWCPIFLHAPARSVVEATLHEMVSVAYGERFVASFFAQLNALRGWPEFGTNNADLWIWGDADPSKTGLISDSEPQSEADKLARMASTAAQIEHLSIAFRNDVWASGRFYLMAMVLGKPATLEVWDRNRWILLVHFLHELGIKLGQAADPILKECIAAGADGGNWHGLILLKHWKPLLRSLTLDERYRVLQRLASFCAPTEVPPSDVDLAFVNAMIDMASLLRGGDKPEYLRVLLLQAEMPPCDERRKVFDRIRAIAGKLSGTFAGRIDTREIVLRADSKHFFARMVQHRCKKAPLTRAQADELIAAAGLNMCLNEEQVRVVLFSAMDNSYWRDEFAEKLEPEHWTALLHAFEQKYGKPMQARSDPASLPAMTEQVIDPIDTDGHAPPIPRPGDDGIDVGRFDGVGNYEEWFSSLIQ